MADRFYFFLLLNEHGGFRQITEVGLLMSRTTAVGMSFIYPLLLLSMSRNLLTILRQKYINQVKHMFDILNIYERLIMWARKRKLQTKKM
jgi:hypothetical protein